MQKSLEVPLLHLPLQWCYSFVYYGCRHSAVVCPSARHQDCAHQLLRSHFGSQTGESVSSCCSESCKQGRRPSTCMSIPLSTAKQFFSLLLFETDHLQSLVALPRFPKSRCQTRCLESALWLGLRSSHCRQRTLRSVSWLYSCADF